MSRHSHSHSKSSKAAVAAAQRERSLLQLLDPTNLMPGHTIADLYSLRHLSLQGGIPDSPSWLRSQAWKVLLGYLPPEKKEWSTVLSKRRKEYYRFVSELSPSLLPDYHATNSPSAPAQLAERDALLDQIYKDLARSRKNGFAFYQSQVRPCRSCPLAPDPSPSSSGEASTSSPSSSSQLERLKMRHALVKRLAQINPNFAEQLGWPGPPRGAEGKGKAREELLAAQALATKAQPAATESSSIHSEAASPEGAPMSPPIYLSPPSPGGASANSSQSSFASAMEQGGQGMSPSTSIADADDPLQVEQRQQQPVTSSQASGAVEIVDRNWHSLLRILYFFALLNPSIGYVQGMNEALFTLFYAFGTADALPTGPAPSRSEDSPTSDQGATLAASIEDGNDEDGPNPHAEADAFWCFSILIGEVKELYDFEGVDRAMSGNTLVKEPSVTAAGNFLRIGMAGALKRLSLRLKWLDPDLWRDLRASSLDPRMPYYSFRWLACLVSTELSLPSVLRVWDALLAEQETAVEEAFPAKIEFLIDICCALLIQVKPLLPTGTEVDATDHDRFSEGMRVLQAYPDEDIAPVIEKAVLFRQRRLASELTGDGPPDDDCEDVEEVGLASVRARAAQTLQRWGKSASPQAPLLNSRSVSASGGPSSNLTPAKGGWFGSMGRSFSGGGAGTGSIGSRDSPDTSRGSSGWASAMSTPSRPSMGGVFQRYAEAFQSSDAAANISKVSTNLTAKALERFGSNASGEPSPDTSQTTDASAPGRLPSLGSVGANVFRKPRSSSNASSPAFDRGSPRTPDMARWSRDTMPDFPLPNVSDSPAGRMEYTDSLGKRISVVYSANGRQNVIGSPTLSEPHGEGGFGSLPLPSLRVAAKLGILPRQRESPSQVRGAGPKPLLLKQSARPPREGSNNGLFTSVDEPSRKVSTGPLANTHAVPGSRSTSRTSRRDSSMAGSVSGRSSRTPSDDGSGQSTTDSPNTSMTSHNVDANLPLLPSLNGTSAAAVMPLIPPELADLGPLSISSGPIGLMGNAKEGTVSAGAFAKVRAAAAGSRPPVASSEAEAASTAPSVEHQPKFGEVSSSSDIPLVTTAAGVGIARPRPATSRKRGSASTVGSASNSVSGSIKSSRAASGVFSVTSASSAVQIPFDDGEAVEYMNPAGLEDGSISDTANGVREGVELVDAPMPPVVAALQVHPKRDSVFEKPRAAPVPPVNEPASVAGSQSSEPPPITTAIGATSPTSSLLHDIPTRYELHDEPAELLSSSPAEPVARTRARSSSSVVRSKRFTKGRTSISSSSSGTNGGSITRRGGLTSPPARGIPLPKPTLEIPSDDPRDSAVGTERETRALPSPGPEAGEAITTAQLLDQLMPLDAAETAPYRFQRSTLSRPNSYASNGSYGRSSTDGPDLLRDDMFAAPTTALGSAGYRDGGYAGRNEGEGMPLSSSDGTYFPSVENGLEAIGSSLAFPESDVEDSFGEETGLGAARYRRPSVVDVQ